jgi:hypothetical protein
MQFPFHHLSLPTIETLPFVLISFCAGPCVFPYDLAGESVSVPPCPVPDRTRSTILRETLAVIKLYTSRGFTVRDLHTDGEFECIRDAFLLPP